MFSNSYGTIYLTGDNTTVTIGKMYSYINKGSTISITGMIYNKGIVIYVSKVDNPGVDLNDLYNKITQGKDYILINNDTKKYTIINVINGMHGSENMQHLELTVT